MKTELIIAIVFLAVVIGGIAAYHWLQVHPDED